MAEVHKKISLVRTDFQCECGGLLFSQGFRPNPDKLTGGFPHKCGVCGVSELLPNEYPIFKPGEEDGEPVSG